MTKANGCTKFGKHVARLLRERDLTAYRLAKLAGLTRQQLSQILRHGSRPSWDTVCRIAEALQVPTDSLR